MTKVRLGAVVLLLAALAHAQTPAVNAGGIVNTGSYAVGGVAPGSIVSIFGTNLANQLVSASNIPLPTALGNVQSVTFNGVPAGLYFVSGIQINAEVPWNVLSSGATSGTADVVVTTNGGASAPQSVPIVAALPGIFTITSNGLGQGIVTSNNDGDIAAGTLSFSGLATHPIQIGDYLIVWCTGLGAVNASIPNGGNTGGQTDVGTLLQPDVLIGGVKATFVYSVLSPQYAGEYQIGVQVATGTPTGTAIPLQIAVNGITTSGSVTIAVAPSVSQPLAATCTLTSSSCTAITLNSDPAATTAFAGYADPTIREDPQTNTLWMAYSYPHTIASGGSEYQGIDTHLSYSTDGGKTWNYEGALYTSQQVTNPVTGQTDYTANEVMNLLPQVVNGVTYWYGIHSLYNVPPGGGGGSSLQSYTKRWEIAMTAGTATTGPMGLTNATPQFLGQSIDSYPQDFPITQDLTSLNSQLGGCTQFYEPALIMSGNNLYLFLSCTGPPPSEMFYAVFTTSDPQDYAGNWVWTYVPQASTPFANERDAMSVGSHLGTGATYITQMDVAWSKTPGVLLAIMTAAYNDSSGKMSLGCAAAELASVDPPMFVYNSQGQVQVDAVIASPDSVANGPGSCTYSPDSATGMIMAHLQTAKAPQNGGVFTFLMQSLLFP
jgi:uncharacterized protein (TIGR03437 family)